MSNMFSWGEDWLSGFRLKHGTRTGDGVRVSKPSFHIRDLSVSPRTLAFIKANGDAFIVRSRNREDDGRAARSKQKFVQAHTQAVCCSDDDVNVTLLSQAGSVHCVDVTHTPFINSTPQALCNVPVSQIACGSQHTIVLTREGHVFTWGQGSWGQLGLGESHSAARAPTRLHCLSAIPLVQVAAGGEHSLALSVSGGVFSWGRNHCGQLGLGDTTDRHTPTPVGRLKMKKTVHLSCGRHHTAIMTKEGAVFTFGCGRHGQLGHNATRNEPLPRMVAELWGAKVTRIACGRHHTLVLTESNRVYSFGCDDQGQLGRGKETHPSVPLPIQLPHDSPPNFVIEDIYAGGDSSFALCAPEKEVLDPSDSNKQNKIQQNTIDGMIDKWATEQEAVSLKQMKQEAHRMFSSASCLNGSFLDWRKDRHFQTSATCSGLDLERAKHGLTKLMKMGLCTEVTAAVLQLLPSLEMKPLEVEGLRVFLILTDLLQNLQQGDGPQRQQGLKLAEAVAATIQSLPADSLRTLGDWWSSLSHSTLIRHVKAWKRALSELLSKEPVDPTSAQNIIQILQKIYTKKKIPDSTFTVELGSSFLEKELRLWRQFLKQQDTNTPPLILGRFNFLMDLKSKMALVEISNRLEMEAVRYLWQYEGTSFYLELKLKRASFVEDAFRQLVVTEPTALKKPLVVYFDEDPKITNVYKTDFFHHFFRDLISTKSGMFMFNDCKTLAWFPSKTPKEDDGSFYLFGVVCGLAVYNQNIIYLPFPLVLFKKLLDMEPTLEDMMEFRPTIGQSLRETLNYDKCLENLFIYFEINWDGTNVDLDPENPGKQVTNQNKKEFVDAYVNYAFNTSVQSSFQEFQRGFFQVCDKELLRLFRPEELRTLLVGRGTYDWEKLKQNAHHDWRCSPDHPNIQMFWEVFDDLAEEQKKDFLWFVTGNRGVPVLGMDQIQMQFRIALDSNDQCFPTSLTCHSILELPLYSTKEIMRQRLTEAVKPKRGFTSELDAAEEEMTPRERSGSNNSSTLSPTQDSGSELALDTPEDTVCTSPPAFELTSLLFSTLRNWCLSAYNRACMLWSSLRGGAGANTSGYTH